MKKGYDRSQWASRSLIPHLDLKTKLIGMFYRFLGINYLLTFLYVKFVLANDIVSETEWVWLGLGILMISVASDKMKSPFKENRDLTAVIMDGIIHSLCTLGILLVVPFWGLLIFYEAEMVWIAVVIWRYWKRQ